jgi:F420-non-reducing hydrogenase small subunit
MYSREEIFDKIYTNCMGVDNPMGREPRDDLPPLTEKVAPLSSVIDVDVIVPGCPPVPELIAQGVMSLLEGKPLELPHQSVCEPCPKEKDHTKITELKRWYRAAGDNIDTEKCFLEQGYVCMGPATWGLCDARCTRVGVPCRGCHGPLNPDPTKGTDPGIDTASFLATLSSQLSSEEILEAIGHDPLSIFYQHQLGTAKLRKYKEK